MSKWSKFSDTLLGGKSDQNIEYEELVSYLERLGWKLMNPGNAGSHRKYSHPECAAAVNLQCGKNGKAKTYQVEQVRMALDTYTGKDKGTWLEG